MARGLLMMLLPLDPTLMLMPGTAMATTDTDLMDTDTGTARGLLMRRLPPLDPMLMLMLMPGTDMVATTAGDTGLMDTDTGMARGLLMRRLLLLDPTLMQRLTLMDGTAMDTATPTDTDTTMA